MQLRDRVRGGGVPDARGAELPQPARRWPSGSAWCADAVQLLPRMAQRHGAHSLSHLRLPPALSAAPLLCCAQCRENAHLRPERHRPEIVNGDKLLGVNHSPFTTYRSSVVVLADRLTPLCPAPSCLFSGTTHPYMCRCSTSWGPICASTLRSPSPLRCDEGG